MSYELRGIIFKDEAMITELMDAIVPLYRENELMPFN